MAYATADELRMWIGLDSTDYPTTESIEDIRDIMEIKIDMDTTTTDVDKLKFLCLMLTSARILRIIAQRSIKNGYSSFSIEGNSTTKPVSEIIQLADKLEADYYEIISMLTNGDCTYTQFLPSAGISDDTITTIKSIMTGVANVWDFEYKYTPSIGRFAGAQ